VHGGFFFGKIPLERSAFGAQQSEHRFGPSIPQSLGMSIRREHSNQDTRHRASGQRKPKEEKRIWQELGGQELISGAVGPLRLPPWRAASPSRKLRIAFPIRLHRRGRRDRLFALSLWETPPFPLHLDTAMDSART
jgi:hypothetical protein